MTVPVCVHSYVHAKFDDRKIKIKCEDYNLVYDIELVTELSDLLSRTY